MDRERALDALKNLELDAMFQVAAFPFDPVRDKMVPSGKDPCPATRGNPESDTEIHLFSLDVDLVDRLVQDGSYIETLIPESAYCEAKATLTVGVRALLLTNRASKDKTVSDLAEKLLERRTAIEDDLRDQIEAEQKSHGDPITGLPSELKLLGAVTPDPLFVMYHDQIKENGSYFRPWVDFLKSSRQQMGVVIVLILLFALYCWRRVIARAIGKRGELAGGVVLLLLVWVVSSVLLVRYEGNLNEEYNSLPAALVSTLEDLFPGADQPLTSAGQQCWSISKWIIFLILGGMLFPTIRKLMWPKASRWLANKLQALGESPGTQTVTSGNRYHSVIINWSARSQELIQKLQSTANVPDRPIAVIADGPEEYPSSTESIFGSTTAAFAFRSSELTSHSGDRRRVGGHLADSLES